MGAATKRDWVLQRAYGNYKWNLIYAPTNTPRPQQIGQLLRWDRRRLHQRANHTPTSTPDS